MVLQSPATLRSLLRPSRARSASSPLRPTLSSLTTISSTEACAMLRRKRFSLSALPTSWTGNTRVSF